MGVNDSDPGYPFRVLEHDGRPRLDLHADECQTSCPGRIHFHTADYPVVPQTVFRQLTETFGCLASGTWGVGTRPMLAGVAHAVILHELRG
jgi:hypothetical protein